MLIPNPPVNSADDAAIVSAVERADHGGLACPTVRTKETIMGKGSSGGGKGGGGPKGGGGGPKGGAGGPKGGQGSGGNWPSTTGNSSGGGRGNAAPST